jgi:hypothetical protein
VVLRLWLSVVVVVMFGGVVITREMVVVVELGVLAAEQIVAWHVHLRSKCELLTVKNESSPIGLKVALTLVAFANEAVHSDSLFLEALDDVVHVLDDVDLVVDNLVPLAIDLIVELAEVFLDPLCGVLE